jgi:hypothetical protein
MPLLTPANFLWTTPLKYVQYKLFQSCYTVDTVSVPREAAGLKMSADLETIFHTSTEAGGWFLLVTLHQTCADSHIVTAILFIMPLRT